MSKRSELTGIVAQIRQAKHVLLCTHMAPDADAIGSVLALASCVERLGSTATVCCHDPVPSYLAFLPGVERIVLPQQAQQDPSYDLAVSIDASDLERLGDAGALFLQTPHTIQMDHHRTNTRFAQTNFVLDHLPASGNLAFMLFKEAGIPISQDDATCLYAAISSDTGNFCFGQLSAEVFDQVAELMHAGLPIVETARQLHLMKERQHVLLLGRALRSLRFYEEGRLTSMTLTKQDFADSGAGGEHTDKIVNYGLYIPGVEMCYLASETDDEGIKISLRAIAPRQVDGIALSLGGGGHAQASGCTIHAPLAEAIRRVHEAMIQELR